MRPNNYSNPMQGKPIFAQKPLQKRRPQQGLFNPLPKPPVPKKHSVKCCGQK